MEWKDVGAVLKKSIKKTKNGVYLPNKAWGAINKEMTDVGNQYKGLKGSNWEKAYKKGWAAATHSKSAKNVGLRAKQFKKSKAGHAVKKQAMELKHALKKNVKVTD